VSLLSAVTSTEVLSYRTKGGVDIRRLTEPVAPAEAMDEVARSIDGHKGIWFASCYEYPGRYSRWDIGLVNPPVEVRGFGRTFEVRALWEHGVVLLEAVKRELQSVPDVRMTHVDHRLLRGTVREPGPEDMRCEEERTRLPSIFTVIRAIRDLFFSDEDAFLGLYGAFGYDLVFQLEPMKLKHHRRPDQADLVLYLPDRIAVIDHQMARAYHLTYQFAVDGTSTEMLPKRPISTSTGAASSQTSPIQSMKSTPDGHYPELVRKAKQAFRRGDLFEVVPTQMFIADCAAAPTRVFDRLKQINPSPYCFLIHLGDAHLVGSSPEMFVRVEGDRVETCPISGTIPRGSDALEDAEQIRRLLNSTKDEAELTMCTDVDRNDKSRICEPGSVRVIGRRQTELYSHLIHTVDHVEGRLRPPYDSLDAFMTHMWAVTITGAPKRAAIRWIEEHEDSPREWYGGAVGYLAFNGNINTGLTLRTVKLQSGRAWVRVGATLLFDSDPETEDRETRVKAAALLQAIREAGDEPPTVVSAERQTGRGKSILLVDHEDSFVHTLAGYFRRTGADVITLRADAARNALLREDFDLVVLSPGPGRPEEFALNETIRLCLEKQLPMFGVCLGLQGLIEHFGGELGILPEPLHGKKRTVSIMHASPLWKGVPETFTAGLYHSLYASRVPEELRVIARSEDDIVMAVEHRSLPIWAVQFHPESIMTARGSVGVTIIENVMEMLPVRTG
jgi:anthranilate synthase